MTHTPDEAHLRAEDVAAERSKPTPLEGRGLPCMWFATCENHAVRYRRHPILGRVAVCARCDDLAERSGIREAPE
jgi:hypothetical protein